MRNVKKHEWKSRGIKTAYSVVFVPLNINFHAIDLTKQRVQKKKKQASITSVGVDRSFTTRKNGFFVR